MKCQTIASCSILKDMCVCVGVKRDTIKPNKSVVWVFFNLYIKDYDRVYNVANSGLLKMYMQDLTIVIHHHA